jgi:transposase
VAVDSISLFSLASGLGKPRFITKVNLSPESSRLDIHIDFERGFKFVMPEGNHYTACDSRQHTWPHLNFFQYCCYLLHCRVPRVKQSDGKTEVQSVPRARKGSGFTLLFEAFSMLFTEKEMPVSSAASVLKVYAGRIWNIFNYRIDKAHKKDVPGNLRQVGFDETSQKKGHNCITRMVDLQERRAVYACAGKGSWYIKESAGCLKSRQADTAQIQDICTDMSPAFIAGCMEHLPEGQITFDKFHAVKEVNRAVDELRKPERRGNALPKGHKYTFLKKKLSHKLQTEKDFLLEMYPKSGEGCRLREMFEYFWTVKDPQEAESYPAFWCDFATESRIQSFIKLTHTVKVHWRGIIRYVTSNISNGILEGINSKIQLAKERARGYRNSRYFINMIYFICGKLKFDYPQYLR